MICYPPCSVSICRRLVYESLCIFHKWNWTWKACFQNPGPKLCNRMSYKNTKENRSYKYCICARHMTSHWGIFKGLNNLHWAEIWCLNFGEVLWTHSSLVSPMFPSLSSFPPHAVQTLWNVRCVQAHVSTSFSLSQRGYSGPLTSLLKSVPTPTKQKNVVWRVRTRVSGKLLSDIPQQWTCGCPAASWNTKLQTAIHTIWCLKPDNSLDF